MKENLEFYVKKNAGFYLIQYESWTTTLRVVNKVSDFANKLKITDKFYLLTTLVALMEISVHEALCSTDTNYCPTAISS